MRIRGAWLLLLLLGIVVPAGVAAQQRSVQFVYGRLLDDATRAPIGGGAVSLTSVDGRVAATVYTDSTGTFRLQAPAPGEYSMKAERLGYRTGQGPKFRLNAGDVVPLDFVLSTKAVLLAPIEVKVSARTWVNQNRGAGITPFYERMAHYGRLGGVFLTKEQVREWDGATISAMLMSTAGARPNGNGNIALRLNCSPTIYLNGHPYRLDAGETLDRAFSPSDLEAVEVYRGASSLPGEFGGSQGTCAVVLWTRRS